MSVPANMKEEKNIPLSHCLSSHGGNVLFIYPHLNALGWGGLHFVLADALAAKVSHLSQSELLTHKGASVPLWTSLRLDVLTLLNLQTLLAAWYEIPSLSDSKTVVWQYRSLLRKLHRCVCHITLNVGSHVFANENSTVDQEGILILDVYVPLVLPGDISIQTFNV